MGSPIEQDELKRKIRKLKKLELKIRFTSTPAASAAGLVWDEFFDLHSISAGKAKYPLAALSALDKDAYRNVIDEFFFHVYYRFYKENGIISPNMYDPKNLSKLGLPPTADYESVKKKFRQLALKYHPDVGGDARKFIELVENYRELIDKGQ